MKKRFEPWDGVLPKSILSDYDLRVVAYSIRSALHYTTGTPECADLCAMCGNAMRLVVQAAEPAILDNAVASMARSVGRDSAGRHGVYRGSD